MEGNSLSCIAPGTPGLDLKFLTNAVANLIEPEIRKKELRRKQLPCQKRVQRSPATHLFSERKIIEI
jgi:hypothetical protein